MRSPSKERLRLPAAAGHGSMMCAILLTANASPASKLTVSRRSRYMSVQAPSRVEAPSARAVRLKDVFRDMLLPLDPDNVPVRRNDDLVALGNAEDVADRRMPSVRDALEATLDRLWDLAPADQKEIRIVRRPRIVERRAQHVAWTGRAYEVRGHDDDEIGFLLLERRAAR